MKAQWPSSDKILSLFLDLKPISNVTQGTTRSSIEIDISKTCKTHACHSLYYEVHYFVQNKKVRQEHRRILIQSCFSPLDSRAFVNGSLALWFNPNNMPCLGLCSFWLKLSQTEKKLLGIPTLFLRAHHSRLIFNYIPALDTCRQPTAYFQSNSPTDWDRCAVSLNETFLKIPSC